MIRGIVFLMLLFFAQLVFAQNNDPKTETNELNARFSETLYKKGDEKLANKISDSLRLLYKRTGNIESLFSYYNTKGTLDYNRGEYSAALIHFNDALLLGKKHQDTTIIIAAHMNIGAIFYLLNNYDQALKHYLEDAKIMEVYDKSLLTGLYGNIGMLYNNIGELDKAEFYLKRSMDLLDLEKEMHVMIKQLNVLGIVQRKKEKYKESKKSLKKAISIAADNPKFYRDIADIHTNLASLYKKTKEYGNEKHHIQESINYYKKTNNPVNIAFARQLLANFYLDRGENQMAENEIRAVMEIFDSTSVPVGSQREFHSTFAKIMYAEKKYKEAYDQLNLGFELFDTLLSLQKMEQVSQIETKYFYQQKMEVDSIKRVEERKKVALRIKKEKAESEAALAQQKFYSTMGIGGTFSLLIIAFLLFRAYRNKNKSNILISQQKSQIEAKQTEILDSIQYAKRIQTAILPPLKLVKTYLKNSFIIYKPKDVVAGDFYWMEHVGDNILFAAADCTGHGVPGAIVSVICNNGLNRSVREYGLTEPDEILNKARDIVVQEFEKSEEVVKDGMDISLCSLSLTTYSLSWAGANNPIWIIRAASNTLEEIKANKQPIGKCENPKPYTKHELILQKGDSIYIFTDGFQDQFGGAKNKKFKSANFKKLILKIQDKAMDEQKEAIETAFEDWKDSFEQVDDVCVIGVRV
jgi:serine phosphatase RsbU (regulator of sigma subunit)